MSIISINSASGAGGSFAATASNGYRLTQTKSTVRYPSSSSISMSSARSRRTRIPPCTAGCRVLTRPSKHSGCPVASLTSMTGKPASRKAREVPPVESNSQPRELRDFPSSTIPSLWKTLSRARGAVIQRRSRIRFEVFAEANFSRRER